MEPPVCCVCAYLLLIEVFNTHTVNTCAVFSGFVSLRNKQVFRSNPTGCTSTAGQIYVQSHLLHRELMDINLQLAVRQSQDDTGGGAGLGPDLIRGLQVRNQSVSQRCLCYFNGFETEKLLI